MPARGHVEPGLFKATPRGTLTVDDRMLSAFRQAHQGVPRAEIAKLHGVSVYTINNWISRVREYEKDAKNRAAAE